MKKLAMALALAGAFVASEVSAAPTFSLTGGFTGAITIKFQNFEDFILGGAPIPGPVVGAENIGILRITSIQAGDGSGTVWADGQNGAELTGIFRDIIVTSVTPLLGGGFNVESTGGVLDVFINPVGSLNAAGGPGQGLTGYTDIPGCVPGSTVACYDGISNAAGGGAFLSLAFASGINPTDSTVTVDGNFDATTLPATGDAAGYLNVTGGPFQSHFDTNTLLTVFGTRDMFTQNDFCTNFTTGCSSVGVAGSSSAWQLISEDPVRAFFIPEPGTLALLGLSLIGFAGFRRKIT